MAQKNQAKVKARGSAKPGGPKDELSKIEKGQRQQQRMLDTMRQREDWMRWLLVALIIIVILLILFFGYATDWTKGLRKDAATGATNDAATTAAGTDTSANSATPSTTGSTGTGTNTGTSTGSTSNTGTTGTSSTTTGTNSTSKESSSTTNNSTTTNNTTTPATTDNSGLLNLYANSSVGDNISSILDNLPANVNKTCHTELLVQVCDLTEGALTVTTKNLLGTGIVTSITKNL